MNFKIIIKKFFRKIYFTEICLVLISTYLTLLFINFLIVQNKIKNENDIIFNRLENAKKNFKLINNTKTYFPYLIINHETNKFDEILQKYKILPLSSISNKDILLCNENGNPAIYLTDDYGFRNKNSVYFNKEEKIIFLGDSFILGFCHNDNTIANIVNKNLFNKNILNLSQGGTGPLIQSAILREYSDNVKFNTVFWFLFVGNDFVNLSDEINNDYLNKYLKPNYSQRLKTKQEDIDNIYLEITDKYFTLINKLDDKDKGFVKRYKEKKINFRDLFELNEIKNLVKLNRFKFDQINKKLVDDYIKIVIDTKNNVLPTKLLTIIILPDERSFKYSNFEHYYRINYIKKKFQENQISVIDLPTQFKEKYNFLDFYYSRYTHYNEKAQKLIAEIIIENIKEKKLD